MRYLLTVFKNLRSIPNIRKKLIIYTFALVLILILVNFSLFYVTEKNSYINQMEISNDNLIEQIGFSYETVIRNIKYSVYKTTLLDEDLTKLVQNYDDSFDHRNDIFAKLYNIMLGHEYIDSAYMYFPRFEQVLSTSNNIERISNYNFFSDKAVFDLTENKKNYALGPRTVEYSTFNKQIYSIVSSVPLNNDQKTAYLVVNINLDRLRHNILTKFKSSKNMQFYVFDTEKTIIIAEKDSDKLGTIIKDMPPSKVSYKGFGGNLLQSNINITSLYNSESLKWNFVLEKSVYLSASSGYASTLIWFAIISIVMLLISLIVIPLLSRPINNIILKYNEKLWNDFINDNLGLTEEVEKQLFNEGFQHRNEKYGVIVLQIDEKDNYSYMFDSLREFLGKIVNSPTRTGGFKAKIIATNKNTFAVIMRYFDVQSVKLCNEQHISLSESIYTGIDHKYRNKIYLSVSSIGEDFSFIPALHKECKDLLKYKLILGRRQLYSYMLDDREYYYEYPSHLETKLANNVAATDLEECKHIVDDFFLLFTEPDLRITDTEVLDSINRLIEGVLKSITSLPAEMQNIEPINLTNLFTLDEMKTHTINVFQNICAKIDEKAKDEKNRSNEDVFDYIEKNYTDSEISVNKISDDLSLSRNLVSKIINETTGGSFNDLINEKRITLAKKLLNDKSKAIKTVAEEVGYNYSYYFIKIFKEFEGITPGQYRSNMET